VAYIVSSKTASTDTVSTASFALTDWWDASEQQTGDYIVVVGHNDTGTTALGIDAGWTEVSGPAPNNSASRTGVWYKKHTGSTITAPTLTGTSAAWAVSAVLIRDADGTTFVDASAVTEQTANTTAPTAPTATSTTDGCLILRILGRDGAGTSIQAGMVGQGVTAARTTDNITSTTINAEAQIEYGVKATAGEVGTYAWTSTASDGGRQMTLCIRNASGGKIPAYFASTGVVVAHDLAAAPTGTLLSANHATINGVTVRDGTTSGGAIISTLNAQTVADLANGMYGWTRSIGQTQTITTGLAGMYGSSFDLGANHDFAAGLFATHVQFPATNAAYDNNGAFLYFRDNNGGWCVIRPYSEIVGSPLGMRPFVSYLPGETQVDGSGTIDWSIIRHVGYAVNVLTTSGTNRSNVAIFRPILRLPLSGGAVVVVGGTAAKPFSWRDVAAMLSGGCQYKLPSIQGQKQQLIHNDLQIGDGGTNLTYFDGAANALEYADTAYKGIRYRANDRTVTVKLGESDSFKMGASAVGSGAQQNFTLDALTSTSATYQFDGTLFGMLMTFRTGITVSGTSFAGCGEIDFQGTTVSGIRVIGTTSTDAATAFNANSTLTDSTIDLTGTSAAYHLELGTAVTAFTLTDVTFTGTPGTDKIHVKRTTGTVVITLSGSTSLAAGDITSDGATVTLVSGASVTLTGLVAGSEVRAFVGTPTSATLLASTESSGSSFSFSQSEAGNAGFIVVRKADYVFVKIDLTYSGSNTELPVQQRLDRVYANP
jgi:hypothetical protein